MRAQVRWLLAMNAIALIIANGAAADDQSFSARGTRLSMQVDTWPTQPATFVTFGVAAQLGLTNHFAFDFDVASFVGNADPNAGAPLDPGHPETVADMGNVTVGGHGIFELGPNVALRVGLSLSVPTRWSTQFVAGTCTQSSCQLVFDGVAASSRGDYDLQRLLPETVFFRIPIGLEAHIGAYGYYRGELNIAVLNPVGANPTGGAACVAEHGLRSGSCLQISTFSRQSGRCGTPPCWRLTPHDRCF